MDRWTQAIRKVPLQQESYCVSQISCNIARKQLILFPRYKDLQTSHWGACWWSFLTFPMVPWVPEKTLAGERRMILCLKFVHFPIGIK